MAFLGFKGSLIIMYMCNVSAPLRFVNFSSASVVYLALIASHPDSEKQSANTSNQVPKVSGHKIYSCLAGTGLFPPIFHFWHLIRADISP